MKQLQSILIIFLILINSCKKEKDSLTNVNVSTILPVKPPPVASAGRDTAIYLNPNYLILNGSFSPINNLERIEWNLIKGQPCTFENRNSLITKVSDLQPGFYQFELSVYDKNNINVRDTVTVITLSPILPANTYYALNLTWIFPWYNALEIKNISDKVPAGSPLKVFVQRRFNQNWVEAYPALIYYSNSIYDYFIETRVNGGGMYNQGSLYVFYYGTNVTDRPNIKIEY